MPARISTAWRALRTGVAFAAFGLMSVWLGHVWLPPEPWRRAQRAIHNAYRIHAWLMIHLGLIEVRWIGADRLAGPGRKLLVANHPSLIDTALIVSHMAQADCIVGKDYSENPLLREAVRRADYISNDLPPAQIVHTAARYLAEDRTLLIYPEGTRSPEGGLGRFQRGAAHMRPRAVDSTDEGDTSTWWRARSGMTFPRGDRSGRSGSASPSSPRISSTGRNRTSWRRAS